MVPLVVAAPLLLAALVPAVIWGNSFLRGSFWVLLALTVAAVIVLAMTMMYVTVSLTVRWVELRPLGTPAQVVIARFLRSSTMAMADLQRAVVIERLSPGQRRSIKVVLHTPSETVECEPATSAPLSRADAQALTDWLTEQLGQVQIAVARQTEVKQDFLCPDEWWTRSHTAGLWRVPVGEVDGVAANAASKCIGARPGQTRCTALALRSPSTTRAGPTTSPKNSARNEPPARPPTARRPPAQPRTTQRTPADSIGPGILWRAHVVTGFRRLTFQLPRP
ncbi:hypothetical protein ACJWDR_43800 [Streptomyces tauricus]|uniref:hypothetical protein n=1 Tax=Streptomyces tauricus TaxID=68274 RepID=UPI00387F1A5D